MKTTSEKKYFKLICLRSSDDQIGKKLYYIVYKLNYGPQTPCPCAILDNLGFFRFEIYFNHKCSSKDYRPFTVLTLSTTKMISKKRTLKAKRLVSY